MAAAGAAGGRGRSSGTAASPEAVSAAAPLAPLRCHGTSRDGRLDEAAEHRGSGSGDGIGEWKPWGRGHMLLRTGDGVVNAPDWCLRGKGSRKDRDRGGDGRARLIEGVWGRP